MKHSECPIRQTAVTHVGGADARRGTSGPVRLTEALFFSHIIGKPSFHPQQPLHPLFTTFDQSPVCQAPHAGCVPRGGNFTYFTFTVFLLLHKCNWVLRERERGASQKPEEHWSALCWTSTSRCVCHVAAGRSLLLEDVREKVLVPLGCGFLCRSC